MQKYPEIILFSQGPENRPKNGSKNGSKKRQKRNTFEVTHLVFRSEVRMVSPGPNLEVSSRSGVQIWGPDLRSRSEVGSEVGPDPETPPGSPGFGDPY